LTVPNFTVLAPEIVLAAGTLVLLLVDAFLPREKRGTQTYLYLILYAAALAVTIPLYNTRAISFNGMIVLDNFAVLFKILALGSAGIIVLLSHDYLLEHKLRPGEYYALLSSAILGIMILAAGADLISIFVGLELMAIPTYVLAGIERDNPHSNEAALKYFLLGATASAILLYGISWLYGLTGTTNLAAIYDFLARSSPSPSSNLGLLLTVGLLLAGLSFKIAAVPFHMWTPDAYEGAPTPVTTFMAVGPKVGGMAAILRIFITALVPLQGQWLGFVILLAVLTMTLGNIAAIAQSSLKRMLAYSSIAHAGYMLLGISAIDKSEGFGLTAILFYTFAYAFMTIGAFTVVLTLRRQTEGQVTLAQISGLGRTLPLSALAMTIFMISLTGIPPTVGFIGKVFLLMFTIKAGLAWLALLAVINSAISAYYYLRVVVYMYMKEPDAEVSYPRQPKLSLVLGTAVLGTVLFGIWSEPIWSFAHSSAMALLR